jgi:hypothetical protein
LELTEEFKNELFLKCAAEGSTSDLLAAANGYIDDKGKICGDELKYYLRCEFNSTSVLLTAIQNSNQSVIEFLIEKCTTLIQQLPFEHQVLISTTSFNTPKIKILCELLEVADFPFPGNLNSKSIIEDINLKRIIDERTNFHKDIDDENTKEIQKFKVRHPKLNYAYNIENKSALGSALDLKKFKSFYFLKSLRFCDQKVENFTWSGDAKEKKEATKIVCRQRRTNVEMSKGNPLNSALALATRSFIYQRNERNNELESSQHAKIREWFEAIYKTNYGSKLLDAAAQCDELKIIFDFECESVRIFYFFTKILSKI